MKIKSSQVHGISEDLMCGYKVFINLENGKIKSLIDADGIDLDMEIWGKDFDEIDYEWSDYIVIEKMKSGESFQMMADFIEEVSDEALKRRLIKALNRKKPFANFKNEIDSSSSRQSWFGFRDKRYIEYVKQELEAKNIVLE